MIVYISENLHMYEGVELSSTDDDMSDTAEEFHEVHALLDTYGVNHSYSVLEDGTILDICQQKITLDEFAVNDLFANVLNVYFDIEISYANYGGKGCDFALTVTPKKD